MIRRIGSGSFLMSVGVAPVQWHQPVTGVPEIQPDQHPFGVREVADDFLDRFRQPSHERRYGEDLVAARELWILQEIDDLDLIAAQQVLLALDLIREPEHGEQRNE